MVAVWYLPRLFIYHRDAPVGGEASATFMVMERRLLKAIGTPAMLVAIVAGVVLATLQGQWTQGWLHAKLLLVFGIAACHGIMARDIRRFAADERPRTTLWYRVFNEVPTVLFVGIVILAVFKPF
jgi:protoporphyrinogen IX oxidase